MRRKDTFKRFLIMAALCAVFALCGCAGGVKPRPALPHDDADLTDENAAGLEARADYRTKFRNGGIAVGDVMPYYENGTYSFFYLAEGDGVSNHPVYRVDTTDFVHYTDRGEALAPGAGNAQDSMIGTGSIVKAGSDYYFFYTGFLKDRPEAVMVAKSEGSLDRFQKVDGFLMQPRGGEVDGWDFRDPEAFYDEGKNEFTLFVSARKNDTPVIARYTVSGDLTNVHFEEVAFSDTRFGANVLECPDVFPIGDKWYLTYSVQDVSNGGADGGNAQNAAVGTNGKMFYAISDRRDGPYTAVYDAALDGVALYAGKTAQDGSETYLAGWVRSKGSNAGWQYTWGGNLTVHQLTQNEDGSLNVAMPQSIRNFYSVERDLDESLAEYNGFDLIYENKDYHTVSGEYSSYLLHTTVNFDAEVKEFGFALAVSSRTDAIMELSFVPFANKMRMSLNSRQETGSKYLALTPGRDYDVKLLVEGSVVTCYVNDSVAFTSRVRNIGNKKLAVFAQGGSVSFRDFHLYTPSEYADTAASGSSGVTVTEAGAERRGRVDSVVVGPNAPAEVKFVSKQANYARYTLAAAAESGAQVQILQGKAVLADIPLPAGEPAQETGETSLAAGETLTVRFTADTETRIHIKAGFETKKTPFDTETVSRIAETGKVARYIAGESGVYGYTATLYYTGSVGALPRFLVAGKTQVSVSEDVRLVTVRGAVKLAAGDTLDAGVLLSLVQPQDAYRILLDVTRAEDTFAAGVATNTRPLADNCVLAREIVPAFAGVSVSDQRDLNAVMNADAFGEQGKNGFVYAYGRAGDELYPMSEYNDNGEVWDYKHKAPEASEALEIKADYMKQAGGYLTAVVWIAPKDGTVGIDAAYTQNDKAGWSQVQLWRNRTLLRDALATPDADTATVSEGSIPVRAGDALVFAVRSAGLTNTEGDGNYRLSVFEGMDLNAPVVASYADDFNARRQGDYGWHYAKAAYAWDPETVTSLTDLAAENGGWGAGSRIGADGTVYGNETAVVWTNESAGTVRVNLKGSVQVVAPDGGNAAVRLWLKRADGTAAKLAEGFFQQSYDISVPGVRLNAGDSVAVVFFDNRASGCKLELTVSTTDTLPTDKTALSAAIDEAAGISNDDGRYTGASYEALRKAIQAATEAVNGPLTYLQASAAVAELRAAVSGLELNGAAAAAELRAQVERAEALDGKQLLDGRTALDEALAAAKTVLSAPDAEVSELVRAAQALAEQVDRAVVKAADFAADFTGRQGQNGWYYYETTIAGYAPFTVGNVTQLGFDSARSAFTAGDTLAISAAALRSDEMAERYAALGYRNFTATAHTYVFRGVGEYIGGGARSAFAYVVLRANGRQENLGDWNTLESGRTLSVNLTVTLGAGDTFLILLRDADKQNSETRLTLAVGCNDTLTADTTALNRDIAEARAIALGDYTADSYAALQQAIANAQAVADDSAAEPAAVEAARASLAAAVRALSMREEITAWEDLQEYLNGLAELNISADDYTAESYAAYSAALEACKGLVRGALLTEIEAKRAALETAYADLTKKASASFGELTNLVAACDTIAAADYTAYSYTAFSGVLASAKELLADPGASNDAARLNDMIARLTNSRDALVDISALTSAVNAAADIALDTMESDSTGAFTEALAAAKEILAAAKEAGQNVTAEQVTIAANALAAGTDRLSLIVTDAVADYPAGAGERWTFAETGLKFDPTAFSGLTPLSLENGIWASAATKVAKSEASLSVSTTVGAALYAVVTASAEYELVVGYLGVTRSNARVFISRAGGAFTEVDFIGTAESFRRAYALKAGDRVAVHIEGGAAEAKVSARLVRGYSAETVSAETLTAAFVEAHDGTDAALLLDAAAWSTALAAAQALLANGGGELAFTEAYLALTEAYVLKAADLAADLSGTQGANGWYHFAAEYDWGAGGVPVSLTELAYTDGKWGAGDAFVSAADSAAALSGSLTAVEWRAAEAGTYVFTGTLERTSSAGRYDVFVVRHGEGNTVTAERVAGWAEPGVFSYERELAAGEGFLLVLREDGVVPSVRGQITVGRRQA